MLFSKNDKVILVDTSMNFDRLNEITSVLRRHQGIDIPVDKDLIQKTVCGNYYFTVRDVEFDGSYIWLDGFAYGYKSDAFLLVTEETIVRKSLTSIVKEYKVRDKLIVTTDIVKINNYCAFQPSLRRAIMNLRGQVVNVLCNERNSQPGHLILSELNDYYFPIELIGEMWYEGYVPPKIEKSYFCSWCNGMFSCSQEEFDNLYNEDKTLCPKCRQRHFVTPYHRFQPHIDFYKKKNDDNLFLGVELEVDNGGEDNYNAETVMRHMNKEKGKHFVYCSHDSSLSDGFEIITQPATLKYHKSIKTDYGELFSKLVKMGYRSHQTHTAGIHVHFSREFFADNEEDNLAKLLYLVEKFWDEITIFSRRNYNELQRYSKKIQSSNEEFISLYDKKDDHDGHYYAVNICNKNTIELRVFRGTLNIDTFMAILEFVDSLVRTAKNKTVNELQSLEFEDMLTPLAKRYYKSRLNAYKFEAE